MKQAIPIAILAALLAPAPASGLVAYGRDGPPTLDRLAREADCIVIARVDVDSSGWLPPDTSRAAPGRMPDRRIPLTRVVLVVEREIVSDTTHADTLYSWKSGGSSVDSDGRRVSWWVEDQPFSECNCDGRRCVLFLDPVVSPPLPVPGGRAYFPIDPFRAILPIGAEGKVARVPVGKDTFKSLPLETCVKKIRSARRE